jgi:hypothetical protein
VYLYLEGRRRSSPAAGRQRQTGAHTRSGTRSSFDRVSNTSSRPTRCTGSRRTGRSSRSFPRRAVTISTSSRILTSAGPPS